MIPARLMLRDLASAATILASSSSDGMPAVPVVSGGASYWKPAIVSNTGLAFGTGQPSSLGKGGLYLKNLATGTLSMVLVNATASGVAGNGNAGDGAWLSRRVQRTG